MTKTVNRVPLDQPVFFQPNRVWRCYNGGLLLEHFIENQTAPDGNFPEDWLASTTNAQNGSRQQHPQEGLSFVRMPDGSKGPCFLDVLRDHPRQALGKDTFAEDSGIGVLCKLVDSAIRLPIQCHPDIDFARKHYKSEYGKTESWLILGTREINGEAPYLLLGFKPDIDPDGFKRAVLNQDIQRMEHSLHRITVKPGDMYLIPGRLAHAIGPGVFMLEVQEPTDWVIQPERYIGATELSATDMWGPLDPVTALECFDFSGADTLENIRKKLTLQPQIILQNDEVVRERIIGPEQTECFRVDRLTVLGKTDFHCDWPWHIVVITQGSGCIHGDHYSRQIRRGDYFFVPNGVKVLKYTVTDEPILAYLITR